MPEFKMQQITSNYTAESGHWYTKDGKPAYTVIGKNGKERPTTLRDARKEGYLPSVTTILKIAPKPALETWKQKQVLMAALTLTRQEQEADDAFIARIMEDSKQQAIKAAERGTQVHAWVQQGFEGKPLPEEGKKFYEAARQEILTECGEQAWFCEKPFAAERYGGKVDLYAPNAYLFDFKTKEDISNVKTWGEHDMQISAYQHGVKQKQGYGGIVFISTITAEAKVVMIEVEKLDRGWQKFNALLDYWYADTGLGEE